MLTIKVIEKKSGRPMVQAQVVLYHGVFNLNSKESVTDSQGEAHFSVEAGEYRVTVNGMHFAANIKLHSGRNVLYV